MFKTLIVALMLLAPLIANETSKKEAKLVDFYPKQTQKVCVAGVNLEVNRRGCCSRHEGVCGCDGDRVKCCDGTLSPTCKCGE